MILSFQVAQQSLKFPQVFYLFRTCQILYVSILSQKMNPIIKITSIAQWVKNNKQKEFKSIQICEKCFILLTLNSQNNLHSGNQLWKQMDPVEEKNNISAKPKETPQTPPLYTTPMPQREREGVRKEGGRNVIHNSVFLICCFGTLFIFSH